MSSIAKVRRWPKTPGIASIRSCTFVQFALATLMLVFAAGAPLANANLVSGEVQRLRLILRFCNKVSRCGLGF